MIRKYTFGKPFETEAVVKKINAEKGEVPYLKKLNQSNASFQYNMGSDDKVYGLGQNVRGINKRGWIYESNCSDEPSHIEDKRSLYGAHNFLIVNGRKCFGIMIDYPGKVTFDIGYTVYDELIISIEDDNFDLYIIDGDNPYDIVKEFRQMIGRSYIPPKWAFGYGQSRWGYMSSEDISEVVKNHRDNKIPLDSVYLDIDYMERYKDFTINVTSFPKFSEFVKEMREQGIHLVPIIDAGVKIEDGYSVYEEGVQNGYFCRQEDGKYFVAGVWPGRVHFPDFLDEKTRKWFGYKYKFLFDKGIDGFWNDMNEPAMFYSESNLKKVLNKITEYKDRNLDIRTFFELKGLLNGVSNNEDDYKSFYHTHNGEKVRHDKVHNLYGYNMTRAAGEVFEELEPDKRIMLISRASYIGMHRYGGIWTGDNASWWSHLLLNIHMMPSLNMCGFLFTGADIGGFGSNTTEDLLLRWIEFGIFTPLMRNHSAIGTRRQEAYQFGSMQAISNIIKIRYGLLPYIYSEYMKSALRNEMYFRPLSFDYPEDKFAAQVEDQLLLGDSIMIAPVHEQNAKGRYVYIPERMKMVKMKSLTDRKYEIFEKGHHYIEIDLDEVVFFIRINHILPLSKGGQNVEDIDYSNLEILGFVENEASYELYDDDGYKKDYYNPSNYTDIAVDRNGIIKSNGVNKYIFNVNI